MFICILIYCVTVNICLNSGIVYIKSAGNEHKLSQRRYVFLPSTSPFYPHRLVTMNDLSAYQISRACFCVLVPGELIRYGYLLRDRRFIFWDFLFLQNPQTGSGSHQPTIQQVPWITHPGRGVDHRLGPRLRMIRFIANSTSPLCLHVILLGDLYLYFQWCVICRLQTQIEMLSNPVRRDPILRIFGDLPPLPPTYLHGVQRN